ncbi:BID domain-containing T4SS effector [Bartonella sp. B39]
MKRNRPSPSETQNPEQDLAPSPSTPLDPETLSTTQSPQSPPSLGGNEPNAEQLLEEQHIYDSPSSPPHSIHSEDSDRESIYSIPSSPGESSFNEVIYSTPPSPPRSIRSESSGQGLEDSIYQTPSNRPFFPPREGNQPTYDVPPRAGQPRSRREHVYDVPSSNAKFSPELPPRPEEFDVYEIPDPVSPYAIADLDDLDSLYAEIPDLAQTSDQQQGMIQNPEEEPIYEIIPDLPQSGSVEQHVGLTPEVEPVYATVGPKLPPHLRAVKQNIAEKSRRGSVPEDTPPDLPPRPEDLGVDSMASPEQKPTEAVVRPKVFTRPKSLKQSTAKTTEKESLGEPFRPELPPRPKSMEQSTTGNVREKSWYEPMAPSKPLRRKKMNVDGVANPEQKPAEAVVRPKVFTRPKSLKQSTTRTKHEEPFGGPFRPELPPRPKDMEQSATGSAQEKSLHRTAAPSKPPRSKKMSSDVLELRPERKSGRDYGVDSSGETPPLPQKRFSYSREDTDISTLDLTYGHVYATVSPKASLHSRDGMQATSSHKTSEDVPDSSQGQRNLPRMKKSSLTQSQVQIACSAYRNEVRNLCSTVFGKNYLLDGKLDAVKKDPDLAEGFLVQLTSHPTSFHKLAGVNVCGIKNKRRKEAEAGIFFLCEAFANYAKTEAHLKAIERPRNLEMEMAPLSSDDVNRRVHRTAAVQQARGQIRGLCERVFGDPNCLDNNIQDNEKVPRLGEELSWQVENQHYLFGNLVGHKICGIKTSARKEAEALIPALCKAIENHADHVQKAKENILQTHQKRMNSYKVFTEKTQHLQGPQKEITDISRQAKKTISEDPSQKPVHKKVAMTASI